MSRRAGLGELQWQSPGEEELQALPPPTFPFLSSEIVRAMTYVINQGMAMYWGTSRWSAMEIMVKGGVGWGAGRLPLA